VLDDRLNEAERGWVFLIAGQQKLFCERESVDTIALIQNIGQATRQALQHVSPRHSLRKKQKQRKDKIRKWLLRLRSRLDFILPADGRKWEALSVIVRLRNRVFGR
jgi:hypothetical protein